MSKVLYKVYNYTKYTLYTILIIKTSEYKLYIIQYNVRQCINYV